MMFTVKNRYLILIIAIVIVNIGSLCVLFIKDSYKKDLSYFYDLDQFYNNRRKISSIAYELEGEKFSPQIAWGNDSLYRDLKEVIQKDVLIFHFSITTCKPCLDEVRDSIARIFPDYSQREDIIFISNDLEKRLRKNYYGKIIAKCIQDNQLLFEKKKIPLLFILTKDMKIKNVFIVDKQVPHFLGDYLKIVKKKYFMN